MKVFISFLNFYFLTLLFTFLPLVIKAKESTYITADSIRISLLTCQPGKEIYSLYGHTAIRYQNKAEGIDLVVNYGMFSFQKPFFILRFVFGLTDYEMGIETFNEFCRQYSYYERGVYEQVLNLSQNDKKRIAKKIEENYRPENRVYRYNYFDDNCTTRARDMIVNNIDGVVSYHVEKKNTPVTFRNLIHLYTKNAPWARFGNDLLLGVKADLPITNAQQQFLPENLLQNFDKATIKKTTIEPLVMESSWILPPSALHTKNYFITPWLFVVGFAMFNLLLLLLEIKLGRRFLFYDFLLMSITGVMGCILFLMIFSKHPTVSVNLQLLFFNPLSLIYSYTAVRNKYKKNFIFYSKIWGGMLCLFVIGAFFQNYAEGMVYLALSLLLRLGYYILKQIR